MKPTATLPLARTSDLATQQMQDEILVYDKRSHRAHCLNPLAALVWKHCDGCRSKEDLAALVHQRLGMPANPDVIDLALFELSQISLLEEQAKSEQHYTRREIVGKLIGGPMAAMVLTPLIASIMTQSAMAQASPARTTTVAPTTTTTQTT